MLAQSICIRVLLVKQFELHRLTYYDSYRCCLQIVAVNVDFTTKRCVGCLLLLSYYATKSSHRTCRRKGLQGGDFATAGQRRPAPADEAGGRRNREAAGKIGESAPTAGIQDLAVTETTDGAVTDRNTGRRSAFAPGHALSQRAGSCEKRRIGWRRGRGERGQETIEIDRGLCGLRGWRRSVNGRAHDQEAQKTDGANPKRFHERDLLKVWMVAQRRFSSPRKLIRRLQSRRISRSGL